MEERGREGMDMEKGLLGGCHIATVMVESEEEEMGVAQEDHPSAP